MRLLMSITAKQLASCSLTRFQRYGGLLVKFSLSTDMPLFNALVRDEDPNFRIATFGLKRLETSMMSLSYPFSMDHVCNGQADRH